MPDAGGRDVADEWMRSNDPGPMWELIDGEDDGSTFRYTYQTSETGEIRTYVVVVVDGVVAETRQESVE